MLHTPRKWAILVATGPFSIAAGILGFALAILGAPGGPEAMVVWISLSYLSVPLVMVGIWQDTKVVERETSVGQRAWLWNIFALFAAPLVGTIYLYSRRGYFASSDRSGGSQAPSEA